MGPGSWRLTAHTGGLLLARQIGCAESAVHPVLSAKHACTAWHIRTQLGLLVQASGQQFLSARLHKRHLPRRKCLCSTHCCRHPSAAETLS